MARVLLIIAFYTVILMTASYFYTEYSSSHIKLTAKSKAGEVEELITILKESDNRRLKSHASMDLVYYGKLAVDPLIGLLNDPDPVVRDFSIQALAKLKVKKTVPILIDALKDENSNVRVTAAFTLGT